LKDHLVEGTFNGTTLSVARNNGTPATAALASVFNGTADHYLFSRDSFADPLAGYIGEYLFYTSLLTAEQRLLILNYLSEKWGIPLA